MGVVTANISIYIPAAGETNYDQSFAAGMINIDQHDHSGPPTKGVPINSAGITAGAITYDKLNANVADTTTGIGVTGMLGANQLSLLGLIASIYQLASNGIIVNTAGVASVLPYATSTWVPGVSVGGNALAGGDFDFQLGGYVQIGNIVFIWANIQVNSLGGFTGAITLTNLPFALSVNGPHQWMQINQTKGISLANATTVSVGFGASASTTMSFSISGCGSPSVDATNLLDTMCTPTIILAFSGFYIID